MNGIIYKIKCLETDEFYIGSTFNLNQRISRHKSLRYSSREIIKRNNYKIFILDEREYSNNLSLKLIENLYILVGKKTKRCVNKYLSHNTINTFKHYQNIWRNNNKEKIINYSKYHYKKRLENDENHIHNHYIKYKEQKLNKMKEKIICNNCNKLFSKSSMYRHKKICN